MRIRAEFQAVKAHRHAALHRSAKCQRKKIRHHQTLVIEDEAASAGQPRNMKNGIRQLDLMGRIAAPSAKLPIGKCSFTVDIRAARRRFRRAQILADVQQVYPSAVTKIPFWMRIVLHVRLGIDVRSPRVQDSLFQREAILSDREFRGNAYWPWKKPLCREANRLPIDCP